jgi:hypothetical protein
MGQCNPAFFEQADIDSCTKPGLDGRLSDSNPIMAVINIPSQLVVSGMTATLDHQPGVARENNHLEMADASAPRNQSPSKPLQVISNCS